MKTNKHKTLLLAKQERAIRSREVVLHFGYSPGTARSYPSYLSRQGLLERTGNGYVLTERGLNRLQYFEVSGCADPDCPLCQGKKGCLTCPQCGFQMPRQKVRILKERDFLLMVRHAGVYCPECWHLIFSEPQARLLGFRAEE